MQIVLLTFGITRDYQLKHEDNNALHATFARSHLRLGLQVTRGQNYFYNPSQGAGLFYPNHPPGPGLVLAAVYGITGHDGPAITRAVAIAFHVLGTWLFYGLLRRVLRRRWELVVAMLLYVGLPESAFFGRMLNHEVLVLPAAILLVRGYWESAHGTWSNRRSMTAIVVGAIWAVISGWAGFFAIGACALHAGWEVLMRRNRCAIPDRRIRRVWVGQLGADDPGNVVIMRSNPGRVRRGYIPETNAIAGAVVDGVYYTATEMRRRR